MPTARRIGEGEPFENPKKKHGIIRVGDPKRGRIVKTSLTRKKEIDIGYSGSFVFVIFIIAFGIGYLIGVSVMLIMSVM